MNRHAEVLITQLINNHVTEWLRPFCKLFCTISYSQVYYLWLYEECWSKDIDVLTSLTSNGLGFRAGTWTSSKPNKFISIYSNKRF